MIPDPYPNMVHVCFVVPAAYTVFNKKASRQTGGSEMQAYQFAKGLALIPGLKVSCLSADYGQADEEVIENVRLVKSFSFSQNKITGLIQVYKTLRLLNPDVCIFRSPSIGVAAGIFIAKKLLHKKTIYMIAHDVEISFKTRRRLGFFAALFMHFAYKTADAIAAQTQYQKKAFENNLKIPVAGVIRNIIQSDENPTVKPRNEILWVGRCDALKQPDIFLQMAKDNTGMSFTMICPAGRDHELWSRIHARASQIPNLTFLGYIDPTEIRQYYYRSKLYVSTAFLEGYSNSMTEALSCGCPVLAFNHNPDQILTGFKVGKSADGDAKSFLNLFAEMINDEEGLKEMGANGPSCIKAFHNKDESLLLLKNLIFELLKPKT